MEWIKNENKNKMRINIGRIKPFYNKCKVTGDVEEMNIEISYIPKDRLLELGSYREYFEREFEEYIEDMTSKIYDYLKELLEPEFLEVSVFLTEKTLTPWSVTIRGNEDGTFSVF